LNSLYLYFKDKGGHWMTLKLENVTKKFGDHIAVNNLSIEIPEKTLFGFLGGNGAGKTTTFRMILDLIDQTEGSITWNNERSEEHTSELQSRFDLVCRLLLEKKKRHTNSRLNVLN